MVCVVTGLGLAAAPVLGSAGAGIGITASVNAVAALEGASVGTTIMAMGEGALVGAGAVGGGSSASIALATLAGPVGWAIVGCNKNNDHTCDSGYTWDCWKPVVIDDSVGLSRGITLRDLYLLFGEP
jgi:hypothetical protein